MTVFAHRQSAHCESGVAANLLTHQGITISEAMAFGIGAGIFFGYLPFIRLNGLPLVTYPIFNTPRPILNFFQVFLSKKPYNRKCRLA